MNIWKGIVFIFPLSDKYLGVSRAVYFIISNRGFLQQQLVSVSAMFRMSLRMFMLLILILIHRNRLFSGLESIAF